MPSSLDQSICESEGDGSVADLVGKPDDTTELFVKNFLETLDERERIIVEGLMDGKTQADIGRSLEIGQVQVSRNLKKIRSKYEAYSINPDPIQNPRKEKNNEDEQIKDVKKVATKHKTIAITEEAVNKMHADGLTYAEVAKEFDVSFSTINYHIQK